MNSYQLQGVRAETVVKRNLLDYLPGDSRRIGSDSRRHRDTSCDDLLNASRPFGLPAPQPVHRLGPPVFHLYRQQRKREREKVSENEITIFALQFSGYLPHRVALECAANKPLPLLSATLGALVTVYLSICGSEQLPRQVCSACTKPILQKYFLATKFDCFFCRF